MASSFSKPLLRYFSDEKELLSQNSPSTTQGKLPTLILHPTKKPQKDKSLQSSSLMDSTPSHTIPLSIPITPFSTHKEPSFIASPNVEVPMEMEGGQSNKTLKDGFSVVLKRGNDTKWNSELGKKKGKALTGESGYDKEESQKMGDSNVSKDDDEEYNFPLSSKREILKNKEANTTKKYITLKPSPVKDLEDGGP
ncbi:hypothetical protein HAX54_053500 [Datura stramonium]|uniref:Uncharacterized protein n=1 Tax=Datura stramonium TaxID=4076 RepID=A0ABS8WRT6_DATST|nr:hypothetical protein [Datura stramonium]